MRRTGSRLLSMTTKVFLRSFRSSYSLDCASSFGLILCASTQMTGVDECSRRRIWSNQYHRARRSEGRFSFNLPQLGKQLGRMCAERPLHLSLIGNSQELALSGRIIPTPKRRSPLVHFHKSVKKAGCANGRLPNDMSLHFCLLNTRKLTGKYRI